MRFLMLVKGQNQIRNPFASGYDNIVPRQYNVINPIICRIRVRKFTTADIFFSPLGMTYGYKPILFFFESKQTSIF